MGHDNHIWDKGRYVFFSQSHCIKEKWPNTTRPQLAHDDKTLKWRRDNVVLTSSAGGGGISRIFGILMWIMWNDSLILLSDLQSNFCHPTLTTVLKKEKRKKMLSYLIKFGLNRFTHSLWPQKKRITSNFFFAETARDEKCQKNKTAWIKIQKKT